MKSDILTPELEALQARRERLVNDLAECKKEHDRLEKKAQAASRVSMNSYYHVQEVEQAIEKIDEAINSLNSVERNRW